jgi:hypothetical protein
MEETGDRKRVMSFLAGERKYLPVDANGYLLE